MSLNTSGMNLWQASEVKSECGACLHNKLEFVSNAAFIAVTVIQNVADHLFASCVDGMVQ